MGVVVVVCCGCGEAVKALVGHGLFFLGGVLPDREMDRYSEADGGTRVTKVKSSMMKVPR